LLLFLLWELPAFLFLGVVVVVADSVAGVACAGFADTFSGAAVAAGLADADIGAAGLAGVAGLVGAIGLAGAAGLACVGGGGMRSLSSCCLMRGGSGRPGAGRLPSGKR